MPGVMLVGEAWGTNEARLKRPFVGVSGCELINMLDESGLMPLSRNDRQNIRNWWTTRQPAFLGAIWDEHPEIKTTNVFNLQPRPTDEIANLCGGKDKSIPGRGPISSGKYIRAEFAHELVRLAFEIKGAQPNLIIAVGGTASWALTGNTGILKIRGAVSSSSLGYKCLPIIHPAAILRDWSLRHVTVLDLKKALRESAFPEIRRPAREIWIEPSLSDMEYFYEQHIQDCRLLAADIETAGDQITCIGFSPDERRSLVVPFTDPRRAGGSYWGTQEDEFRAWNFVRRTLNHPSRKIFQNGLYDITFLWKQYGITVRNFDEDTMLLHHALLPESQKGLGFLGSVYTNEPAWKLMRGKTTEFKQND